MDISQIEPNFSSSNIDISFTFKGKACSETLNICEVMKKIKYECSKLNKSITKEEKEAEIKRKSDKENFEKALPQETLPELKHPRASLVWYGKVWQDCA